MKYAAFEVPDDMLDRVVLLPVDPRDDPHPLRRVADGDVFPVVLSLLTRCTTDQLDHLHVNLLSGIKRRVAGEEKARAAVTRPPEPPGVQQPAVGSVQALLDEARAEDLAAVSEDDGETD